MARAYLDTSFFIGLLENQEGRQDEAKKIATYERANDRFTSILTLNEFMTRVFDRHKHDANCGELVSKIETQIRSVVRVVGLSEEIAREAARLQSVFGEVHKHAVP
ncbi:MAG TPA: PIN domain-containing protein, partial [Thermoanaerobaculia bacterium]|nr:PIN domain-containing protein [Thermoanaerobaculia bacterium]